MEQKKLTVDDYFKNLIIHFTTVDIATLTTIHRNAETKANFMQSAKDKLIKDKVPKEMHEEILTKFDDFLFGYYKLQPLLDDKNITDIRCLNQSTTMCKKYGKRYSTNIAFDDEAEFKNFVNTVAIKNGKNLSMINAQQIFTDTESHPDFRLRIDIQTEFLNSSKLPFLHIRKIPKVKVSMEDLLNAKPRPMMSKEVYDFIINQVKANKNMIVCGPNASGKTYLLNAAIDKYPKNLSGLCMQESDELFSDVHKNILFQHTVMHHGDGKISYSLKDEIRYGLMSDNDLFIIGEIKDEAALYVINAAYTGSTCWMTVHSVNSREAVQKIADYAMYEAKYEIDKIYKELSYMNMVIYVEDFQVTEISMITGSDKDGVHLDTVYSLKDGICNFDKYYAEEVVETDEILIFNQSKEVAV